MQNKLRFYLMAPTFRSGNCKWKKHALAEINVTGMPGYRIWAKAQEFDLPSPDLKVGATNPDCFKVVPTPKDVCFRDHRQV